MIVIGLSAFALQWFMDDRSEADKTMATLSPVPAR